MILDELKIIEEPDDTWVTRLRRDHFVYLTKEKRFAKIEWAYEPPEPGYICGQIGLRFCHRNEEKTWSIDNYCQTWYIFANGNGLDGKKLLLPLEGNCPDSPTPISEPWIRQTERVLSLLISRVDQLEAQIRQMQNMM